LLNLELYWEHAKKNNAPARKRPVYKRVMWYSLNSRTALFPTHKDLRSQALWGQKVPLSASPEGGELWMHHRINSDPT